MTNIEKLQEFIEDNFEYASPRAELRVKLFNLKDLIQLRELVKDALIERMCEQSSSVFHPIFKESE